MPSPDPVQPQFHPGSTRAIDLSREEERALEAFEQARVLMQRARTFVAIDHRWREDLTMAVADLDYRLRLMRGGERDEVIVVQPGVR